QRIAQLGEWVQPGSPICTLVRLDRLRVEGDAETGSVATGTPVVVKIQPGRNLPLMEIEGRIGFVSAQVNSNNHHRVWVEIDNQKQGRDWIIKPGMQAKIEIQSP
ncbi:MAG: HlyD family efflux transporter periplasmic adaptor subunit, partial [Planctomycetota bacterium]